MDESDERLVSTTINETFITIPISVLKSFVKIMRNFNEDDDPLKDFFPGSERVGMDYDECFSINIERLVKTGLASKMNYSFQVNIKNLTETGLKHSFKVVEKNDSPSE
jgi:hypothetical protein